MVRDLDKYRHMLEHIPFLERMTALLAPARYRQPHANFHLQITYFFLDPHVHSSSLRIKFSTEFIDRTRL